MNRPVAIIRTLPSLYEDKENVGHRRFKHSLERVESGKKPHFYIALDKKPVHDVLHIYLLVDGEVQVRLNIAGYLPGGEQSGVVCWDGEYRQPNWWVICTAPVSYPPELIKRRGFQGFRYIYEDLW